MAAMHSDSGASEANTAPKERNSKFIPFLLLLLCGAVIGFGIRYYSRAQQTITEGTWEVYFS